MSNSDTSSHGLARTLHDVGLAAWFGGSLMGAVGLNGAAATASSSSERTAISRTGWDRWTPVNAAAIGAHLLGAVVLTGANKGRLSAQQGVAGVSVAKGAATLGALAVTAYARKLGSDIEAGTPAEGATEPSPTTSHNVAEAQRKERYVQWAIPALTGLVIALGAKLGEQQQPTEVARGIIQRLNPAA